MPPSKKPQPGPAKRGRGRPKGDVPPAPVTGFRVPAELLERVDRIVEARNKELAPIGAKVNRSAVVVAMITEGCERAEAAAAGRT